MLKFLIIIFLIGYLFFKVGGFIFRIFLGRVAKSAQAQYQQQNRPKQQRTRDGVNIDYVPESNGKRSAANFKGGEYVDYEELK